MASLSVVSMFGLFCATAGGVTPTLGAGGFIAQLALPGISDVAGPKLVTIPGCAPKAIALRLFIATGADRFMRFVPLSIASIFCLGLTSLSTRPIATEAAPTGVGVWLFLKEMAPRNVGANRPAPVRSF
jgi:hypothetical protein